MGKLAKPKYAKPKYPARLPSTGVTNDTYDAVIQLAKDEGVSLGEIQRRAIKFFLSSDTCKASNDTCKTGKAEDNQ